MRVLIAAGGTAGHVVPALAVADALRERGAEVEFAGGERAEKTLVPKAGYPLHELGAVRGIDRRNPLKAVRALLKALGATRRALKLMRGADAVLGAGGYVAGPVGAPAALKRGPMGLVEAVSHLRLTTPPPARFP